MIALNIKRKYSKINYKTMMLVYYKIVQQNTTIY